MQLKILSLNCQRGYQPGLEDFLRRVLVSGTYDFVLLQECAKEVPSYVRGVGPYELLEQYDEQAKEVAQTCALYRKDYQLLEKNFIPFVRIRPDPVAGFKHSTFGSLFGRFQTGNGAALVGSVHLHSGINRKVRAAQMQKIKEQVLSIAKTDDAIVFGGDCNFGLPRERAQAERILAPQFVCTTRSLGSTLDGRYSENVPHLPNRIAAILSFFGIPTPLWTDHLFVDAKTASNSKIECRVLPDRISDHSPVELLVK